MHKSLLTKLMMMTSSENDQEALTALRKANKILKEAGVNWEELLDALSKPAQAAPPPRPEPEWEDVGFRAGEKHRGVKHTNKEEIDKYFAQIFSQELRESFAEFVESVNIWWRQHGFLTDPQYQAIKRAAERVKKDE